MVGFHFALMMGTIIRSAMSIAGEKIGAPWSSCSPRA